MPLARTTIQAPGPPPPVLYLRASAEGHQLQLADREQRVPLAHGLPDVGALGRAIEGIDPGPEPLAGVLIGVPPQSVARELVRLLHAVRSVRPEVPVAVRAAQ